MADKFINELPLRANVTSDVNFPVDDGIQDYRVTASQILAFIAAAGVIVPTGAVMPFAAAAAPAGFLLCQGQAVSRSTYASLFAVLGTTHGNGDGTTTFNLPDYRGRFLRGVDSGAGRDVDAGSRTAMGTAGNTGDTVGSVQGHAFQTHTHLQNPHQHFHVNLGSSGSVYSSSTSGASSLILAGNEPTSNTTATNQNAAATGTHAQASTGETRPVNAAVHYIIKI